MLEPTLLVMGINLIAYCLGIAITGDGSCAPREVLRFLFLVGEDGGIRWVGFSRNFGLVGDMGRPSRSSDSSG
jgi:hypothetical protein